MPDLKSRSQLADAAADLMRSCVVATAQTMTASACQGLMLWSDLLRGKQPRVGSAWGPLAGLTSCNPASAAAQAEPDPTAPAAANDASVGDETQTNAQTAFSTYRSAGGHAVAQVIVAT